LSLLSSSEEEKLTKIFQEAPHHIIYMRVTFLLAMANFMLRLPSTTSNHTRALLVFHSFHLPLQLARSLSQSVSQYHVLLAFLFAFQLFYPVVGKERLFYIQQFLCVIIFWFNVI
jgi:hypothetical protein